MDGADDRGEHRSQQVIDLSNLKAPGWQKVVAELSASVPDDRTFLARLLAVLGQVSGARQAVLFAIDAGQGESQTGPEPRPMLAWPTPDGAGDPALERPEELKTAARSAAESGQIRAFGLDQEDTFYDGSSGQGYIVSVPVQGGPPGPGASEAATPAAGARGVITLLLEARSKQALQTTMALIEVLAGYIHAHAARQQLRRTRSAGAALDLAGRMIAAVNLAGGFRGSALQLCNDLSRQLKVDRVALGWVRGVGESGAVRVSALSDTEHIDRRLAMVQKIEAAMDECLDQEQAVVYPVPPEKGEGADVVLAQAITHAHRELASADAKLKVASLPLRCEVDGDQRVVGVVTIESTADGPIDSATIELLQATLDLVAPALRLRRSDDRNLALRAWASTLRAGQWLVGPRHTAWKLAGLLALALAAVVTFVQVPYRISAPVELLPRERRVLSAPFDGVIASLPKGMEAGREVKAGDVVVELDTIELRLGAQDARDQILQSEKEADNYRRQGKLSDAQQAEARAAQYQARLDLAEYRIAQARVRAPIDGVIVEGDLRDKVGAAVKLGDALFVIASVSDLAVVARVGDRDISYIREGGTGSIATKADPARAHPVTIERIVPQAQAREGRNAFEVWARLDAPSESLLPRMEGLAKLDVGDRTLLWIGTRRVRDALRLWLWW